MTQKGVMVIDETLPLGIIANTAGILGDSIGAYVPEFVKVDVVDQSNYEHKGIVTILIPILKGNRDCMKELRSKLYEKTNEQIVTVNFSDLAQGCKNYTEYGHCR